MTLWRRIERIEAETRRQAEADRRLTELIVNGPDGEIERVDLTKTGWVRIDVDNEQQEARNGQLGQAD